MQIPSYRESSNRFLGNFMSGRVDWSISMQPVLAFLEECVELAMKPNHDFSGYNV